MSTPETNSSPPANGIDLIREYQQRPNVRKLFEGLDVSYKETKNGNIFVTYTRHEHKAKESSEKDHNIVAINGGRNPLMGDFCKQVKGVLEQNPTVTSFTVMHFPYSKSMPDGGPIISPSKVIQDLEEIDQTLAFEKGRRLTVMGVCLGADIIEAGLRNGLTNSCSIDEVFMISPGTGFEEGRRAAENKYLPMLLREKFGIDAYKTFFVISKKESRENKKNLIHRYRYQFARMVLDALNTPVERQTKLQAAVAGALSRITVTETMYNGYIALMNKVMNMLLPPNIEQVASTYKATADELDQMLKNPPVESPKVPYIRVAWTPAQEIIGDENRELFMQQMTDLSVKSERKDIMIGYHGSLIKIPKPYTEAFNEIIAFGANTTPKQEN